jgi:hypothetical protein
MEVGTQTKEPTHSKQKKYTIVEIPFLEYFLGKDFWIVF